MSQRDRDEWRAALAAAYARGKKRGEQVVDLSEMVVSPEALAAVGLTSALINMCASPGDRRVVCNAAASGGQLGFHAAGHDGDLDGGRSPNRPALCESDGYQRHLLHRYCAWRASGGDPRDEPLDCLDLDSRLVAVANAASGAEIDALARELGDGAAMQRVRIGEYRAIGRDLIKKNPSLSDVRPGPPPMESGLPRRSWQPAPPTDDDGLDLSPTDKCVALPAQHPEATTDLSPAPRM
jgi:hypothetical protein